MTGMVNRAKGLLGRKSPAAGPTPFTTRCLCGESIHGYRRAEYQVLTCPQCSSSVFLLARNPLPEPEGLEEEPAAPARQRRAESAAGAGVNTKAKAPPAPRVAPAKAAPRRAPAAPREPIGPKVAAALQRLVPPKRWFTLPRLIFSAVVVLVAITVAWQMRSQHLQHLREELIPRARRGLQALTDGQLSAAHENLAFTVNAMDTLREHVPDGLLYRQAFAELDAVDALLDQTLSNALFGGSKAPDYVSSTIRGKALLLDVVAEPDGDGQWGVHYLAFMDDEPVQVDASSLDLWQRYGFRERTRVIFGVRIAGIEKTEDQGWLLRLIPDSGVLITEPRIAEELGLVDDPTTAEVLARQREMVAAEQNKE